MLVYIGCPRGLSFFKCNASAYKQFEIISFFLFIEAIYVKTMKKMIDSGIYISGHSEKYACSFHKIVNSNIGMKQWNHPH